MADLQSRRSLIARSRNGRGKIGPVLGLCVLLAGLSATASAQENGATSSSGSPSVAELAKQVSELRDLVEQLQAQLKQLQANTPAPAPSSRACATLTASQANTGRGAVPSPTTPRRVTATAPASQAQTTATFATLAPDTSPAATPAESQKITDALHGTTLNFLFDGYYACNFNAPIGRANLLRAYDVSSNAFSLVQGDVVLENAPDVANNKRSGARLDFQFGQATENVQGNATNQPAS